MTLLRVTVRIRCANPVCESWVRILCANPMCEIYRLGGPDAIAKRAADDHIAGFP